MGNFQLGKQNASHIYIATAAQIFEFLHLKLIKSIAMHIGIFDMIIHSVCNQRSVIGDRPSLCDSKK